MTGGKQMDKTAEECISLIESDRGNKLSLHNLDVIALKFLCGDFSFSMI